MRTLVINRALPAIQALRGDCLTGTSLDTFAAAVANGRVQRLVVFKRRVGNDKAVAYKGTVNRAKHSAAKSAGANSASLGSLSKINNNVGCGLPFGNGRCVNELVSIGNLGIGRLVSLYAKIWN